MKEHDRIHPVVQAIVCEGRVLVPSKTGRVYAIDAATGEKVWKWEKAGPIVNSAGCADGRVIFGSLDGKVRALRAADGSPARDFDGGIRGFSTAPCIAEGEAARGQPRVAAREVFIGARDGTFYCLEAKTGKRVWATDKVCRLEDPAFKGASPYRTSVTFFAKLQERISARDNGPLIPSRQGPIPRREFEKRPLTVESLALGLEATGAATEKPMARLAAFRRSVFPAGSILGEHPRHGKHS